MMQNAIATLKILAAVTLCCVFYVPTALGEEAPIITSDSEIVAVLNDNFSYTITTIGAATTFDATGLPAGLSLNPNTGVVSGAATATGEFTVTISATNSGGTDTNTVTLSVISNDEFSPIVTSVGAVSGTINTNFQFTLTAADNPISFSATGLPPGLSLNSGSGVISGQPTQLGSFPISVSASNDVGTGTGELTIVVNNAGSPVISTATQPDTGFVGDAYTYTVTVSNSPTSFSAQGLPPGLTISSAGVISGTPTELGIYPVAVFADNATGTGAATFVITVFPVADEPPVTSPGSATAQVGVAFSFQIRSSIGSTSFSASNLPPGLKVSTLTGLISGVPTEAGTFIVKTVAITSFGRGTAGRKILTLRVLPAAPEITSQLAVQSLPNQSFQYTIGATNDPYVFQAAPLPQGVSLSAATGTISGTPVVGRHEITITAENAGGTAQATLVVTIADPNGNVVISVPTSASATVGVSFSMQITVTGAAPVTVSVTGLPSGLSFDEPSRTISGSATVSGTFTITVNAGNLQSSDTQTFQLIVSPAAGNTAPVAVSTPTATPNPGIVGVSVAFSAQFTDADGDALVYTWDFGDGASSTGASVTHTYAQTGIYNAKVTVNDGTSNTIALLTVVINGVPAPFPGDFQVSKAAVKFNFVNKKDQFSASGVFPISASASVASGTVEFSLAGFEKTTVLDAKGKSDVFKFTGKPKSVPSGARLAKFSIKVKQSDLFALMKSAGFVDNVTLKTQVNATFALSLNSVGYADVVTFDYKVKAGKTGSGTFKAPQDR